MVVCEGYVGVRGGRRMRGPRDGGCGGTWRRHGLVEVEQSRTRLERGQTC